MQIDAFNEILVLVSSWFKQFVDEKQFVEITQVRQKTKPDSKLCIFFRTKTPFFVSFQELVYDFLFGSCFF